MKCTYCENKLVFRDGKKKTKRAGKTILRLKCPACGELFLANDSPYSHPYQTHPNRLSKMDRKEVYAIRMSQRDILDVENGRKTLTIINNRLQLQYKHS